MVAGVRPFYLTFWVELTHRAAKTAIFTRYLLVAAQPLELAKKVQLWLIWELSKSFPTNLRWTAYVAPKPSKGASKATFCRFRIKNRLRWKKVCCKVCLCENCQRQSCKAFTGLSICAEWLVGDVPFCVKFWVKMTHPASKTAIFTRYSPVATVLWQNKIIVCKCADYWSNLRFRQRGTSLWHTRSGWTPKLRTMKCSLKKLETLFYRTVFIHWQIISSFCHNPRIWQTDRQTDGRTDGRTDVDSN